MIFWPRGRGADISVVVSTKTLRGICSVRPGDYDRAIEWLERAFEVRDPMLPYNGFYPIWDPLRSDPRFQDLLRRMNLPTTGARSDPDEQR